MPRPPRASPSPASSAIKFGLQLNTNYEADLKLEASPPVELGALPAYITPPRRQQTSSRTNIRYSHARIPLLPPQTPPLPRPPRLLLPSLPPQVRREASPFLRPFPQLRLPVPAPTPLQLLPAPLLRWQHRRLPCRCLHLARHLAVVRGTSARSRRAIVGRLVREEGSWNVAWDARPARWLHGSNSAWLLFGVCSCFLPFDLPIDGRDDGVSSEKETGGSEAAERESDRATTPSLLPHAAAADLAQAPPYKVTGVSGDGRCLFRAVAYGDCLRNGKAAPDEALQKELADDLRARVANELLKRREETEWFIEGDFESYVKNIQQPHAWGGEPELLMASHVLQKPISVFMMDGSSGDLVSIASYGQEYRKGNSPITVLFHGYGHYDALEVF
ncbi:uncharacterized protein LOC116257286 [Nymphaea colorata]|uniref:uncharacterized protein LOC116257286 n=1 Tax=Nymphaea colorata TaxID=210225 RepID=UPI00214EE128|nr:uncharacterized protein LOC116257286 [Nymphaea colorata]